MVRTSSTMPDASTTLRTLGCTSAVNRALGNRLRSRTMAGSDAETSPSWSARSARIEEIGRSEEHTSELQSLMRISYAVFCLKKKNNKHIKSNKLRVSKLTQ